MINKLQKSFPYHLRNKLDQQSIKCVYVRIHSEVKQSCHLVTTGDRFIVCVTGSQGENHLLLYRYKYSGGKHQCIIIHCVKCRVIYVVGISLLLSIM